MSNKVLSGITTIDLKTNNPFELFQEWQKDASRFLPKANTLHAMNLATSTKNGCVSNRNVLILRYDPDGFVFITDSSSRKARDVDENPNVSASFLWCYSNNQEEIVTKQVRLFGVLNKLNLEETKVIYDSIPIFRKVRYHIIEQGKEVDNDKMKELHDKILSEMENGKVLEMPSYVAAYKLSPAGMEFYYAYDNYTADRVLFTQQENKWQHVHLSA